MSGSTAAAALGDIFDIARGGSPRPIESYFTSDPNGMNWILIGDASEESKYITRTSKKIRREGAARSRMVKPGDFLLSNSMSFGRPYIMATTGCIHDGWLVLRPKSNNVCSDYFYHLLGSSAVYSQFKRLASGATVKNLNIDLVRSVEVTVPCIEEQHRIAAILDAADALRAKRRAALAKLDTLTQSIFFEMFGDPEENRHNWPIVNLVSIVRKDDNINYGVIQPGDDVEEGVPLVRVGDLIDGRIRTTNLKRISRDIESAYKRSRLRGDEVLVSCVGSVGTVALCDQSCTGYNIARAVARIPVSEKVSRVYITEYLRTPHIQQYFEKELRTVSQPTLNIKQISETKVVLPPKDKQTEFELLMKRLKASKQYQFASQNKIEDLFDALQHRAFRGEL